MSTQATNPPGLTPPVSLDEQARKSSSPWTPKKADARRRRKDAGRSERERAAAGLAQELLLLADREGFDPWRGELNALVQRIRKSGRRTPDRDAATVTDALRWERTANVGPEAHRAAGWRRLEPALTGSSR